MFSEKGPFLENVGCIKVEGRARSKTLRGLETHCEQCSRFLECSSFDILTSFKSPSQPVVGLRFWCFSQLSLPPLSPSEVFGEEESWAARMRASAVQGQRTGPGIP